MRGCGEVLMIHRLCLTLVANILHLVLVSKQDWRNSLSTVALLFGLATEGCSLASRNWLTVVDRLKSLGSQAEARANRLVKTRLVETVVVVGSIGRLRCVSLKMRIVLASILFQKVNLALEANINRGKLLSVTICALILGER